MKIPLDKGRNMWYTIVGTVLCVMYGKDLIIESKTIIEKGFRNHDLQQDSNDALYPS